MENKENSKDLLLTAPIYFEAYKHTDVYHTQVAECAEKLALSLQPTALKKNCIYKSELEQAIHKISTKEPKYILYADDALMLMMKTWKYGNSVGFALGMDEELVYWERQNAEKLNRPKCHQTILTRALGWLRKERQNVG